MPVTLSADEFAKKYGGGTTLSADEFAKRYGGEWTGSRGVIPKNSVGNEIADQLFGVVQGVGQAAQGAAHMLRHPIDSMRAESQHMGARMQDAEAAAQRGDTMGVLNNAAEAVPFLGSMTEDVSNKLRNRQYGQIAGNLVGMKMMDAVPEAAVKGVKIGTDAAIDVARRQHGRVIDPSGTNAMAAPVAKEMFDQNMVMRDPKAAIEAFAERKAGQATQELNQAVKSMTQPVDALDVSGKIQNVRDSLFNPETGAPIKPDSIALARKLDRYTVENILGNAKASIGPNGNVVFELDPELALEIKRSFDEKPGARGVYTKDKVQAVDTEAQASVANALRDSLNADPNVRGANERINNALKVKTDVAPNAAPDTLPTLGKVAKTVGGAALTESIAAAVPPLRPAVTAAKVIAGVGGFGAIGKLIYDTVRSPAWQTASAITKKTLAEAIAKKDWTTAGQIAQGVMTAGATQGGGGGF